MHDRVGNMLEKPRLFLIDGGHTLYRSYHAIRSLSTSKGFPTNAIYGFAQTINKVIADHDPQYLVVIFDAPGPTFRHKIYPAYKANRPPMPDDLVQQIPVLKELLAAYRIPCVEQPGYEGDDIICTLALKAKQAGLRAVIVSGDKDLAQLVDSDIVLFDSRKDIFIGTDEVVAMFGVMPHQIQELLALAGDTVDNVPGVPGVGPKTAASLLNRFGSLDALVKRTDEIDTPRLRQLIKEHASQITTSRELVELDRTVPLQCSLEDFRRKEPDSDHLRELLLKLEFHKLLSALPPRKRISFDNYRLVQDEAALEELREELCRCENGFALDLETTSRLPSRADIVGISCATGGDRAYYIPVGHAYPGAPRQLALETVKRTLLPILADQAIPKFGHNIKYDLLVLLRNGIEVRGTAFDTMVASYLLNPSRRSHSLDALALEYLQHKMISYKEVTGSGPQEIGFEHVRIEEAAVYSCEDAHVTLLLTALLGTSIKKEGFETLFHEVEIPLIEVLTDMERVGVRIDPVFFKELSSTFTNQLSALEQEIHEMAGEQFNIHSPQQLGKILFEKLRLPGAKRTKTGYATDVTILSRLAGEHRLPRVVLEYRSLSKLISTYVDALPKLIHPATGRIHTSYNQTVTATGRLSSSDPNLQNIPVRTSEGRKIREGFIPEHGMVLLSADYNQVELRILAHVSGDEKLIDAYRHDEDIHARTASELFGVMPSLVSPEMRRQAKVINFGVIYGMGSYGLAQELNIQRKHARDFIDNYFKTYRGVNAYRDACLEQARRDGYVTTLLGRRRYVPEIHSKDPASRSFAERTAINTPIQGTAADIIKVAMIDIHKRLRSEGMRTRIIMQVHDELVLEVPEEEIGRASALVREEMEGVMTLKVPLKVDIKTGKNWSEAH